MGEGSRDLLVPPDPLALHMSWLVLGVPRKGSLFRKSVQCKSDSSIPEPFGLLVLGRHEEVSVATFLPWPYLGTHSSSPS